MQPISLFRMWSCTAGCCRYRVVQVKELQSCSVWKLNIICCDGTSACETCSLKGLLCLYLPSSGGHANTQPEGLHEITDWMHHYIHFRQSGLKGWGQTAGWEGDAGWLEGLLSGTAAVWVSSLIPVCASLCLAGLCDSWSLILNPSWASWNKMICTDHSLVTRLWHYFGL